MKNKSILSALRRIARLIALLSYLSGVALPEASNAAEGHGHRVTTMSKMKITIGSKSFTVTLYENPTVTALKLMLPLTLEMTELNGNEKYFHLITELPMDAANPGTIQAGDLMLWQSNSLVSFMRPFVHRTATQSWGA